MQCGVRAPGGKSMSMRTSKRPVPINACRYKHAHALGGPRVQRKQNGTGAGCSAIVALHASTRRPAPCLACPGVPGRIGALGPGTADGLDGRLRPERSSGRQTRTWALAGEPVASLLWKQAVNRQACASKSVAVRIDSAFVELSVNRDLQFCA